jgi:AsmA protein
MTTEGQGRTNDPVGFGIPVMIEGSWSEPRIYPDMAGMLDNPDAAYAKLREMGKGLFGPSGAGLGNILGSLGLSGNAPAAGSAPAPGDGNAQAQQPTQNGLLGGGLGEAIGNLIQQGLSGNAPNRSRSIPNPPAETPVPQASPAPPAQQGTQGDASTAQQDSQPMNDVLRQLFNR